LNLELLPFFHRSGSDIKAVFDQIGREVLWLLSQNAKSKHTFTLFVALLALPGATKRGWSGSAVSWNRLNEAHKRAAQKVLKVEVTKSALAELANLGIAVVELADSPGKRQGQRLKSVKLNLRQAKYQAQTSTPKTGGSNTPRYRGMYDSASDPKQGDLLQKVYNPDSGTVMTPKRGQKYPQNGGIIDIGIKGEGTISTPLPIPSSKNDAHAQALDGQRGALARPEDEPRPRAVTEADEERFLALLDATTAQPATHSATPATHQTDATPRDSVSGEWHEDCEGGEEEG
jgi:hypothetical protein